MDYTRLILGLVLISAAAAAPDAQREEPQIVVNRRAVDVIADSKLTTRHPDELEVLLKASEGSDVTLRLRRGLTPPLSVENENGVEQVQLREAEEDAFYEVVNGQGSVMVRSVQQSIGVFKRSLSGSFLHDDQAYVIEAPKAHYSRRREVVDDSKHSLIKRFDMGPVKASKSKRSFQNLGVEVYIIIDYTVYNQYLTDANRDKNAALLDIRRYFAHVMSGVDIRYSNLDERDFGIYVRVKGIHVIETSSESTFTMSSSMRNPGVNDQNLINGDFSLNGLRDWDKGSRRGFISKSDHVMAFTKKNLYSVKNRSPDTDTIGIAFTKQMCKPSSYSVIEEEGVFTSEGTAAHELGHSLGAADHDGSKSAASCTADAKYIMAPANAHMVDQYNYMNPYKFSTCSVRQFREYFSTLGSSNCMSNKATHVSGWERPAGEAPGQIMNAVAQCQGMQGDTSFPCPFDQKLSDVCRGLSCTTNAQGSRCSTTSLAARGTSCGDRKWCENASCVSNRLAPSIDETCPFGDFPNGYDGRSCSSLIGAEPFRCYQKDIREKCCGSCNKIKQPRAGCEYGDHQKFCSSLTRSSCQVGWNNWHCSCDKCSGVSITGCKDDPYALWGNPGQKCGRFISSSTKFKCYQDAVAQSCCASCNSVADKSNIECLFGDNDNYTFKLGTRDFRCSDMRRDSALKQDACTQHSSAAQRCCATCRGF